jgi:hypothetical protein
MITLLKNALRRSPQTTPPVTLDGVVASYVTEYSQVQSTPDAECNPLVGEAEALEQRCAALSTWLQQAQAKFDQLPQRQDLERAYSQKRLQGLFAQRKATVQARLSAEQAKLKAILPPLHDRKFKPIDLAFLSSMKRFDNKDLLPAFAVFTVHPTVATVCELGASLSGDMGVIFSYNKIRKTWTSGPDLLSNHYKLDCLAKMVPTLEPGALTEVRLRTQYTGAMPAKTRRIIRENKSRFDHMFLVVEAEQWSKEVVKIRPADPLLIGVIGDRAWLLDKFDLTAKENWAASEFIES